MSLSLFARLADREEAGRGSRVERSSWRPGVRAQHCLGMTIATHGHRQLAILSLCRRHHVGYHEEHYHVGWLSWEQCVHLLATRDNQHAQRCQHAWCTPRDSQTLMISMVSPRLMLTNQGDINHLDSNFFAFYDMEFNF